MRKRIEYAAQFLKQNLKTGDKVLSLDEHTSLASMLLAGAEPATYYFTAWFLNVKELSSNEYVTRLREDYLYQLRKSKPRFILDFTGNVWFEELQCILDSNYVKIPHNGSNIYLRK